MSPSDRAGAEKVVVKQCSVCASSQARFNHTQNAAGEASAALRHQSKLAAALILLNVPLALIGGIAAL